MVILMFFLNDTEPVPKERTGLTYAVVGHSYFASFLFDRLTRLRSRFLRNFEWSTYYRDLYSSKNSASLTAAAQATRDIARLCSEKGIRLLVVNIPELRELQPYRFAYATDYIRNLAEESGVPFLDLLPALKSYPPQSLWVSNEDPHANSKANAIIAQAIYEKITSEGLLR
jgi:lysophospholipase L1-like esterase